MAYRLPRYRVTLVREGSSRNENNIIRTPEDVVSILSAEYEDAVVETALMLALDTKNKVIGIFTISTGSLNSSIIHPRDIFQRSVLCNAAAIILSHNHPSGDPSPSPEDVAMTRAAREAGRILDVEVLDHIVIGHNKFVSMKDKGLGFGG